MATDQELLQQLAQVQLDQHRRLELLTKIQAEQHELLPRVVTIQEEQGRHMVALAEAIHHLADRIGAAQ